MSPQAGELLVQEIAPRIRSSLSHCVSPVRGQPGDPLPPARRRGFRQAAPVEAQPPRRATGKAEIGRIDSRAVGTRHPQSSAGTAPVARQLERQTGKIRLPV